MQDGPERGLANKYDNKGRTPEGIALTELILTIFRANGRLLRAGDAFGKDLNLTAARWQVMGAVDHNAKTVAQIAREFELTRQGVLWVVQALVKDGLLELTDNPDHRRAKLVRFTPRGREVYDEMDRRQKQWVNRVGGNFPAERINDTIDLISRASQLLMHDTSTD